ncbi:hypothetical protein [Chromobacterium paludis]|uniref:Uncharacterized protein n=1 Tax=Chromobacterium paludis TaxID=2605945 RepID=A0A5C1DF76_9NEIS|nr:hypothetical protein [Chromobacterium paludis]QEL55431.1 hypothetical protein FYK34_07560 [Chromobacterium paludis]
MLRHPWPPLPAACLAPCAWAGAFLPPRRQGLSLFNGMLKKAGAVPYGALCKREAWLRLGATPIGAAVGLFHNYF